MRLPWRRSESESSADSVALVVVELPADELLVEEPTSEELQAEARRMARLFARSRHWGRKLNPARPARIALGRSGAAARSAVVKLRPQKLAMAVREFRSIDAADLARLAHGVGRGAKAVGGRLVSPRKARSIRVVATALRASVRNISPGSAAHAARETTRLARTTIAKLDPRAVEDAVRRFVATIDLDGKGKGKGDKSGRPTRFDRMARAAVAKIGPERAVHVAAQATRALRRLVDEFDPDHVGEVIGELVAAARSATDRKGRLQVVGFLASLVGEVGSALKNVAKDLEGRDLVVVLLVVLTTAPELLVAAGVSVAALQMLTMLLSVLVQVLPDRRQDGLASRRIPARST